LEKDGDRPNADRAKGRTHVYLDGRKTSQNFLPLLGCTTQRVGASIARVA